MGHIYFPFASFLSLAQNNFTKDWEEFKSQEWTIDYSINDSIRPDNQYIGKLIFINNTINFKAHFFVYNDLDLFNKLKKKTESGFLRNLYLPNKEVKTFFIHKYFYYILEFSNDFILKGGLYSKLKNEIDKYFYKCYYS